MRIISHGRWPEDLPGSSWRWALLPVWLIYRPLLALRNLAFDLRLRRVHRAGVPVISIGNLTAGGTGKTPVALTVVELLRARGHTPAILARGYRALDSAGNDEARLAGSTPVICNGDRVAGATIAIANGATALVLDDGFQHRRLHRDLDVVVIDATRPWGHPTGSGAVLPLGYLRESRRALTRAGLLWISRADLVSADCLQLLRQTLAKLAPDVPVVEERIAQLTVRPLQSTTGKDLRQWGGRSAVACCGLGNPGGFEQLLIHAGIILTACHRFPDHHHYTTEDLQQVLAQANGLPLLITTKDAVKIRELSKIIDPNIAVVEVRSALNDAQPLRQALDQVMRPR